MTNDDAFDAFRQLVGPILRVTERAVRTPRLGESALLRRVRPDGASEDALLAAMSKP